MTLSIKHLRGGDYITPNLCLNSETWETKCEPEEEVNLITFTVNGTEYQAEEGMTWEEFINSAYNKYGYFTSYSYDVLYNGGVVEKGDNSHVYTIHLIVENGSYTIRYNGGAN